MLKHDRGNQKVMLTNKINHFPFNICDLWWVYFQWNCTYANSSESLSFLKPLCWTSFPFSYIYYDFVIRCYGSIRYLGCFNLFSLKIQGFCEKLKFKSLHFSCPNNSCHLFVYCSYEPFYDITQVSD